MTFITRLGNLARVVAQLSYMKTYRVTFIDNVTANSEEEAYDALLHYMGQCVKYQDVTCFTFEEAQEEQHQTH